MNIQYPVINRTPGRPVSGNPFLGQQIPIQRQQPFVPQIRPSVIPQVPIVSNIATQRPIIPYPQTIQPQPMIPLNNINRGFMRPTILTPPITNVPLINVIPPSSVIQQTGIILQTPTTQIITT